MRYFFLELLVCPVCKSPDLLFHSIQEEETDVDVDVEKVKCRKWCGLYGRPSVDVQLDECRKCVRREVKEGLLVCRRCGRWYPIVESIPYMLPDKYRISSVDKEFLHRNKGKLTKEILGLMRFPETGTT